jgi:hypothetical protein
MTRADWYATRYGGGWRKCRKPFVCNQSLCLCTVMSGDLYFDTNEKIKPGLPVTKRFCAACAGKEVKI